MSGLVAFHLFAVFVGPWAAIREQTSPLAADCRRLVAPYVDALYLGNGYRFFAPEPGPSHLVKYDLTLPGGQTLSGHFPDRAARQPRLLYHRYFMLSETLNTLYTPDKNAPGRAVFDRYVRSYARHLLLAHQAANVRLTLVEHRIAAIEDIQRGKVSLADANLFEELPLGTFSEDDR